MPKTRLNSAGRNHLLQLVDTTVDCPAERRTLEKAYAKIAPLAVKVVLAKHPNADMLVLKRYDCAHQVKEIKLSLTVGGVVEFEFDPAQHELYRPEKYRWGASTIYAADERLTAAYQAWEQARDAYQKAVKDKRADYKALVNSARNLEEIEAIWPAAASARSAIIRNLPATLTPDAIARIKADVAAAQRQRVAA